MATLGTGAVCCGDPETCPIGVCDQAVPTPVVDIPSPAIDPLDDLDFEPELEDDE